MRLTNKWIKEHQPCPEAFDWWDKKERDSTRLLEKLIGEKRYEWANWLIIRVMTRPQYLSYAIFSAEQVLEIYEKMYPSDQRPRLAIEAAKKVLENDTSENRNAAENAANDAYAAYAAYTAYAAYAAYAAAYAATAAAYDAAYAANAANAAANTAAYAAAYTNANVRYIMFKKILEYGIGLLKKE